MIKQWYKFPLFQQILKNLNRNREIQSKNSIVIEKFNYFRKIYLLTNEMEIHNGFVGTGTK